MGILLFTLLVLPGCDATAAGREAWSEGRGDDALALFRAALDAEGDEASPELLHDLAVAALARGQWDEAERAARAATERGGAAFAGLDAFVRGSRAFARSKEIWADVEEEPDPRALLPVLRFAEDAVAGWQWAAASRSDWPEARRNTERALLWLESLRERRTEGTKPRPRPPDAPPLPPPPPAPLPPEAEPPTPIARPDLDTAPLAPGRVLGVLEILRQKEVQKRALRRARRDARAEDVERDW